MLEKITNIKGNGVYIEGNDIDTDRIIPARFMKCVTFEGLGPYAFYDVRKDENGNNTNHILNNPDYENATILLSNANFGCGSSREHAPQSLYYYGFRAVIAESFAEIFFGNCTTLGIPCLIATHSDIVQMGDILAKNPKVDIQIDLENLLICVDGTSFKAQMIETTRQAFVSGKWDAIADLLENLPKVEEISAKRIY